MIGDVNEESYNYFYVFDQMNCFYFIFFISKILPSVLHVTGISVPPRNFRSPSLFAAVHKIAPTASCVAADKL